ncbi:hypothetical protein L0B53_14540 [Vibrio sp. SS-MA-C1-2]|uniref:hypothetical protein n=1 Tax=Vibrio sp. SS-MA-C1-2 TaxID=2908646 RepID=UPI001F48106C|nr:hypothetical protein [Vibrio sp. SS-MA-C1-2]UJF18226.1 hypothetical protein L0B53_14540 [Vibrio sp. SS-MA-C1-2]
MKNSKNIAIAIDSLNGGGAQKVMLSLAEDLLKLGHNIHFLIMKNEIDYTICKDIHTHLCLIHNKNKFNSLFNINKVVDEVKSNISKIEDSYGKFDLVISNLDRTNLIMSKLQIENIFFVVHASVNEELKRRAKLGPIQYYKKLRCKKALNGKK